MKIPSSQETIGSVVLQWFNQRFHCNKLKDLLLFYVLMSFLLSLYIFINAYQNNALLLWPAILFWFFISGISTYVVCKFISANIEGNFFKEKHVDLKRRILIIGGSFSALFFLRMIKITDIYYYSYLAIPIALSFFVSTLFVLLWLIRYEKRNGTVRIMIEEKRGGKR